MLPFQAERDTPEIRLIRTINDLCYRLVCTQSATERTALRETIATLRTELVKLVEAFPIPNEEYVRQAQEQGGFGVMVAPGIGSAS